MRADIHPKYEKLVATCSCGNVIETRSALGKETIYLDVCSACHPFYTGKQKNVDTGGRIDKFKQRFAKSTKLTAKTNLKYIENATQNKKRGRTDQIYE
jgi:large subunit ribosomal protein L31